MNFIVSTVPTRISGSPKMYNSSISDPFPKFYKKVKFSIEDFFSICEQIHRKLHIWSYLLKKSLIENFAFYAVIVASISTIIYSLPLYLCDFLLTLIPGTLVRILFRFFLRFKSTNVTGKFLIYYDEISLFTNFSLKKTTDIAINLILNNNPNLNTAKKRTSITTTFCYITKSFFLEVSFTTNLMMWVPLGSPLAPILANNFMGLKLECWMNKT